MIKAVQNDTRQFELQLAAQTKKDKDEYAEPVPSFWDLNPL